MHCNFSLTERFAGFLASDARPGEMASVQVREQLTTDDGALFISRIEGLHASIFSRIPGLPTPSEISRLLVIIKPNLDAVAYVNELDEIGSVRIGRAVNAGEPVLAKDILDMSELDVGVEIPNDCAFVFVRSLGWQRSLLYDITPILLPPKLRDYNVKVKFAQQALELIRNRPVEAPKLPKAELMKAALLGLKLLLDNHCEDESRYQEFMQQNPWVLGGHHRGIERHTQLDDQNIPDFTAIRRRDDNRDIIELKQPFLVLFRQDGNFAASFNDAWNQAERYLAFCRQQQQYLVTQKGLHFVNPHCFLIAGAELSPQQIHSIQDKQGHNPAITFLTYENLLSLGEGAIELAAATGQNSDPGRKP